MIGAIISMKKFGKKPLQQAVVFWIIYIVAMVIVATLLNAIAPGWAVGSIVVAAVIFILLANRWYKFDYMNAFKLFAIAFVIDIVIVYAFGLLSDIFGYAIPGYFPFFFGW